MVKDLLLTELYKEVKNSDNTLCVPYYVKTGIIITCENIEFITEVELLKYKSKLHLLDGKLDYKFNLDIIAENVAKRLNQEYLNLEFIYVNSSNIDEAVKTQDLDIFYCWLVK